jgi:probable FeS assembly SUF system protein SufT
MVINRGINKCSKKTIPSKKIAGLPRLFLPGRGEVLWFFTDSYRLYAGSGLTGGVILVFRCNMQFNEELTLTRDTEATIIPAGDTQVLAAGTRAVISQALGGTVTIRTDSGLFRLSSKDWDSLGADAQAQLDAAAEAAKTATSAAEAGLGDTPFSEELVWEAMRGCFDPEIPVNIVDLGLIYDLAIGEPDGAGQHVVSVKMTLTAQGCGMGPVIAEDAKKNIEALAAVSTAQVDIVWDPLWTPHMISEAGRLKLGLE